MLLGIFVCIILELNHETCFEVKLPTFLEIIIESTFFEILLRLQTEIHTSPMQAFSILYINLTQQMFGAFLAFWHAFLK